MAALAWSVMAIAETGLVCSDRVPGASQNRGERTLRLQDVVPRNPRCGLVPACWSWLHFGMKCDVMDRHVCWGGFGLLCLALLECLVGCRPSGSSLGPPPRAVEAVNRGVSLMGQYQYDEAAKAFQEALQASPGLVEAKVNLAMALFNRNRKEDQDVDRSTQLLDEVLREQPGHVRALYFKAIVLQHIGKAAEAVPCLEQVVKQRPEDGAAWYVLALCRQRVGQPAEADLLRAVQFRPYLFSAYYQLYQIAMRAGQEEPAAKNLEQFKKLRESPLGESIELPQYNQMGSLALTRPLQAPDAPPLTRSRLHLAAEKPLFQWGTSVGGGSAENRYAGAALGDLNHDGLIDLVVPSAAGNGSGHLLLLRQDKSAGFVDVTAACGLSTLTNTMACALGDFDNDGIPDLFVTGPGQNHLLKGRADGTFEDVTAQAGVGVIAGAGRSALFLDADHDGDLDIFVCGSQVNQLWNNNGDGVFTNIAAQAGVECPGGRCILALPADLDQDRDLDLVIVREGAPALVFMNELLGRYREQPLKNLDIRGEGGAILQDFNGDLVPDLLALGGSPQEMKLFLGDGHGGFTPASGFQDVAKAAASWGALTGFRVADVDLDGDLDIVCFGTSVHLMMNDGRGRFVLQSGVWKPSGGWTLLGGEVADVTGDMVPDLLLIQHGTALRLTMAKGELAPPSTALAIQPSGIRSRDGRTRSPASGYGVGITARAGLSEQRWLHTGQSSGFQQSLLPVVLGLGGAGRADYVSLAWPDGVAQMETALAAGWVHQVPEVQRKISSCPVLFAWNGDRFECITDFAGVGGLGYFVSPGVSAPPQVLEHVKIEPGQLRAKDGHYELRVTEPMEESAYVDRLELLAVDHAADQAVYPDERLAINGPPPTHELLVVDKPIFPRAAIDPLGRDCVANLTRVDRVYAYDPMLDRRYIGFCPPHTLELDFGDQLASLGTNGRVFLFINGFIEYPYSQTVYAAAQSRIGWEPIRAERQDSDGRWRTIVPDGGAPGGMARMMTIDLTGQLGPSTRKLRLTTNLEICYDQVFLARPASKDGVAVRSVPLIEATLRYRGFPREYSPDGRVPLIYDYDMSDASAPFHVLKGAYTRYGPVQPLLAEFDDRYVIMGPGDEIALRFDATSLSAPGTNCQRSFVLVSHAYCKDMDLYTTTPRTLEPLPFRGMSRYPPRPGERSSEAGKTQAFLRTYNTRWVE
jgi:tetratricopeptide (TPR) repeat protein